MSDSNAISTKRHMFRATAATRYIKANLPEVWRAIEAAALVEYPSVARQMDANERYAFVDKLVDIQHVDSRVR